MAQRRKGEKDESSMEQERLFGCGAQTVKFISLFIQSRNSKEKKEHRKRYAGTQRSSQEERKKDDLCKRKRRLANRRR